MFKHIRLLAAGSLLLLACSLFSPGAGGAAATASPTLTLEPAASPTPAKRFSGSTIVATVGNAPTDTPEAPDTPKAPATKTAAAYPSATRPRATATASSTSTATPRPRPRATATPVFLSAVAGIKRQMEIFGGIIDIAVGGTGQVDCQQVVNVHNTVVAAPQMTVGNNLAGANQLYRQGVDNFAVKTKDMNQNCVDFLANGNAGQIPFQQWGQARQGVSESVDLLRQAIIAAGGPREWVHSPFWPRAGQT